MDVFSEIVKPVIQVLMGPVKKQLGYMISCTTYVRNMRTKMRQLDIARRGEEDHLNVNTTSHLEISSQVIGWLDDVEKMNAEVENFPGDIGSCFNVRVRHKVGRKAFKIIEEIDSVLLSHTHITWSNTPIPLGRVDSIKASTSTPPSTTDHRHHDDFQSREQTFTRALKALGPNQKGHMIALCGMGGVGKTTMMQRLKKVVKERKMFKFIVEAVIGENTDPISIQEAVASYLGMELKEKNKPARADKLRDTFEANSNGGTNKFLIILDDVWKSVDLEDIGLSPFPDQGVDFKILLTSRDKHVCTLMGVEACSILTVGLLKEEEAHSLFHQFVQISDPELYLIGEEILEKCCGLPIAIKTMACTLRDKRKDAWKDALSRLEHHDIDNVAPKVFETSYVNLDDEDTKSVFMLCGLFPEDFNIPTEELMRYGWGLKIFKRVSNIRQARYRLNTCIDRLIDTNLLMESVDEVGCVKIHDLVRAFILNMFLEVEHASIVNHGSMSGWPEDGMSSSINNSCQRISLTCTGMSEFPSDLNFPNLSILKLMYGMEDTLRFPQNFYKKMEKLMVISYDVMDSRLLPSSLDQCTTNLRVLRLYRCSLEFNDGSFIGKLLNLEVLSLASCYSFGGLSSIIENLKKLRLLDLTDCSNLCIDNIVFKDLVRLEEIYALPYDSYHKGLTFTGNNLDQVAERWKNLSALEFEFYEDNFQWKNLSSNNLERFMISVGRRFHGEKFIKRKQYSFENTLKLVTKKGEILGSRINELFEKTVVLCLSVDDMNDIEDVGVKSSFHSDHQASNSFGNLRILVVSKCGQLKYLFTLGVAKVLSNLEHLKVVDCPAIKELIHTELEYSGKETYPFPKPEFLSLSGLPKTTETETSTHITSTNLFPHLHTLTLKCLLNLRRIDGGGAKEFSGADGVFWSLSKYPTKLSIKECNSLSHVIPCYAAEEMNNVQVLKIKSCGKMKEVFETQRINQSVIAMKLVNLKILTIMDCDFLEHIFMFSTLETLGQLEELRVQSCKAMKVIVMKEEEDGGEKTTTSSSEVVVVFPRLKSLILADLPELVGFFLGTNIEFHWPSLDSVRINHCSEMNIFTAGRSTAPQLKYVETILGKHSPGVWFNSHVITTTTGHHQESTVSSFRAAASEGINPWSFHNLKELDVTNDTSVFEKVVFPSNVLLHLQKLENIYVDRNGSINELFEELDRKNIGFDESLTVIKLPSLRQMHLERLYSLKYMWKSNQWTFFEFPNLTTVSIHSCACIQHVFTSSMVGSLMQLQQLSIIDCGEMRKVIVKDVNVVVEDENEKMVEILMPRLKSLELVINPCLKGFYLGTEDFSFPLLDTLTIEKCPEITTFTTGNSSTPELKEFKTDVGLYFGEEAMFYEEKDINSLIKRKLEESESDETDEE